MSDDPGCYGQWKFIDEDMFLPHNAARHELPHSAVGRTKVTALTQWVNSILAEPVAEAGIVANLLDPGDQREAVENALRGAEVIAYFSASQAVARYLARDFEGSARCVSAFMNPSGADLVVLAEDASRQTRLDAVEMPYYRMLLEEPQLSGHFRPPEGKVRTARSCRDVSAVLPGDIVSHHASVASRGFRMALNQDDARIYIWRTDQQFNTRLFQRSPARLIERAGGNALVITDELFLSAVRAERQRKLPRETGGVLLGTWDLQRGIVYVVAMIPSPDDSEERPTSYIRGCQGLEAEVSRGVAETGGQLQYVGEWHSHPDGHSANPSEDDCKLFNWVREYTTQDGYHAFLASKINVPFPDQDEEVKNPAAADEVYQSGVRWLLNHTRPEDNKKFDLIFKENVAYGFRRNALGVKPLGLAVSVGSLLWVLAIEGFLFSLNHRFIDTAAFSRMPEAATASLIVSGVMIVAWLVFFTKSSAHTAAFTYAETLLRACDAL